MFLLFRSFIYINILDFFSFLKRADDSLEFASLGLESKDAHLVTGLIKAFLRSMPDPLITFAMYSKFIALIGACVRCAEERGKGREGKRKRRKGKRKEKNDM